MIRKRYVILFPPSSESNGRGKNRQHFPTNHSSSSPVRDHDQPASCSPYDGRSGSDASGLFPTNARISSVLDLLTTSRLIRSYTQCLLRSWLAVYKRTFSVACRS